MFSSMLDHKDLIFQDSTVRLIHVEEDKQDYINYLGESFMRSMERMHNIDCVTSGQVTVHVTLVPIVLSCLVMLWQML